MDYESLSTHPVACVLLGCPRCEDTNNMTLPDVGVVCVTCFGQCEEAFLALLDDISRSEIERNLLQTELFRFALAQYRTMQDEGLEGKEL